MAEITGKLISLRVNGKPIAVESGTTATITIQKPTRCFWCNTDPVEAAARHEGPHATWCVHYRSDWRESVVMVPPRYGMSEALPESWTRNRYLAARQQRLDDLFEKVWDEGIEYHRNEGLVGFMKFITESQPDPYFMDRWADDGGAVGSAPSSTNPAQNLQDSEQATENKDLS